MKKKASTISLSLFSSGLITYGLVLTVAQVILMRELVSIFNGNELSMGILLAVWLFWTAIGSGFLGKFFARILPPIGGFAALQFIVAGVFPITLYFNRVSVRLLNLPVGEIAGLLLIFFIPLVTLSVFCLCSGALFTLSCRIYASIQPQEKAAIGKVYILEAIGAAIGGVLASLVLLNHFSAYENAALLGALQMAFGLAFLLHERLQRWYFVVLLFFFGFVGTLPGWLAATRLLEKAALARYWQQANIVKNENSIYGTLTVISLGNAHSFYSNGLLMSTVPDLYAAEEAVHLALLQHPAPQNILLIGGGVGGSLQQILAHPSVLHVDYVELDPNLVELARTTLPPSETAMLNDPRVQFHFLDGRLFFKKCRQKYDVILTNLPDPSSTLLNRFYTLEFFREVRQQLNPNGVFGFRITSAENYITRHLAQYIRCIHHTLELAFEQVVIIPGITNYLLAAPAPGVLTEQPEKLIARMQERHLQPEFVNEFYLPFRITPERIFYLQERIQRVDNVLVNQDFKPVAYFFDLLLWSAQTNPAFRDFFDWLASHAGWILWGAILLSSAVIGFGWQHRPVATTLATSTLLAGFTQIGLEVNLIIAFQALYGYAYFLVAFIVAGFMVGITAGSWLAVIRADERKLWRRLLGGQIAFICVPPGLGGVFYFLSWIRVEVFSAVVTEIFFLGLAILAGFWGGYLFPTASAIAVHSGQKPEKAGGTLYGFDLLGACLGALLTSAFLVPLFGIYGTLFLFSLLNALGTGLIILTFRTGAAISVSKPATPLPE
jgi:spermidine synthase